MTLIASCKLPCEMPFIQTVTELHLSRGETICPLLIPNGPLPTLG